MCLALHRCVNKTSRNVNTKQQLLFLAILRADSAPLQGNVAPCCMAEDTHTVAFCWQLGWNWNVLMAARVPPPHPLVFHPSGTSSKMKPSQRTSPCVQVLIKPLLAPHLLMFPRPKQKTQSRPESRTWIHKGMNTTEWLSPETPE